MSGVTKSLPRGASTSANTTQDAPTGRAETIHQTSPVATSLDSRPHEQRTVSNGPDTGHEQTTDVNSVTARSSFASLTFAHSAAIPNRPTLDSRQLHDALSSTMAFPSTGQRTPAQGLSPGHGPTRRGPAQQLGAPHAFAHIDARGFLPLLQHDPLLAGFSSPMTGNGNRVAGSSQGDGGGWMLSLEPLGYKPSMPGPSFLPPVSRVGGWANDHVRVEGGFPDAAMQLATGGDQVDNSLPDFTLMDDALTMWSSIPPTIG